MTDTPQTPATLRVTILGCGSSGGVPRIGGHWGDCDPHEPKNRRTRCAALFERITPKGTTRVLIDTGADLRGQLLAAGVGTLDAVLYTHDHADHVHGIDDLRVVVMNRRDRLAVWADRRTLDALTARFGYVFVQPPGSPYPPILQMNRIDKTPVTITGAGGALSFQPIEVEHGSITALGFRCEGVAYMPDVSAIPDAALPHLKNLRLWILDALRRAPHPTHFHLERSLEWITRMAPERAVLTNLHNDLDYATLARETDPHIQPAHDGLVLDLPLPT